VKLDELLIAIVAQFKRITCRGAFYQCVKHGALEKTENNVKLVERRLLILRRAGIIHYSRIVDESRVVHGLNRYAGLAGLAEDAAQLYRRDYWAYEDFSIQIWVEKRGLGALLLPTVCHKWGLDLYVACGQQSEGYLYVAGNEIAEDGRRTYVYALTDFDPGGETIFRTLKHGTKKAPGGISRFANGVPVEVQQVALMADQVRAWNLPTRPAKKTDGRTRKFIEVHGDVSTELDAIEPDQLIGLVNDTIARHMPADRLARLKTIEEAERESVKSVLAALANGGDLN
jgi:hypothetical protein